MDSSQKKIYLTFDDGPVPGVTDWVLDLLNQHQIPATFFCVGENVEKYPALFHRIVNEKHSVGNHTYHHLNGWKTHTCDYIQNIELCHQVLNKTMPTSLSPEKTEVNYFRPPYGRTKKSQFSMLSSRYTVIMWDVLSGDYSQTTTPAKCLSNVMEAVRNGSIILFHDSYKAEKNMMYALPRFIEFAKFRGFKFASFNSF